MKCKGKTWLAIVNIFFCTKSLLTTPSKVWPPKNKNKKFKCSQLLEGDRIESRLPFKIFCALKKSLQCLPFLICSPFLGSSCSASGSLCFTNSLYKQFSDLDSNISDEFKSGLIRSHLSSQWGHTCSGGGSPYPTRTPPTWSYTPTPFPPSLCWFASWAPWSTPTLSSTFR